jgi:hypothetical protein
MNSPVLLLMSLEQAPRFAPSDCLTLPAQVHKIACGAWPDALPKTAVLHPPAPGPLWRRHQQPITVGARFFRSPGFAPPVERRSPEKDFVASAVASTCRGRCRATLARRLGSQSVADILD